ncbi:MAG: GerMN domain-containing protein [Mycobacteriales bacterium]
MRASSSPSASAGIAQVRRTVYLVHGAQLVAATVTVPAPGRIDQIVRALLSGVDQPQSAAGLRSAIPDGTHLLSFDLAGRVANLDVSPTFTTARSADQILAVAQLVFTATTARTITAVTFSVAGKAIEVPSPDGALTEGPVTRALYRSLLAP